MNTSSLPSIAVRKRSKSSRFSKRRRKISVMDRLTLRATRLNAAENSASIAAMPRWSESPSRM
jgi:hypothetical protein